MHAVLHAEAKGSYSIGWVFQRFPSAFRSHNTCDLWLMTLACPGQCNRQYPCNHCARRRCPEECAYSPSTASQTSNCPEPRTDEVRSDKERKSSCPPLSLHKGTTTHASPIAPAVSSNPPLAELFGYFADSDSNTLALIRKVKSPVSFS